MSEAEKVSNKGKGIPTGTVSAPEVAEGLLNSALMNFVIEYLNRQRNTFLMFWSTSTLMVPF